MSNLRGLTHVLTCKQAVEIPFTLITPQTGDPTVVSSSTITRGAPVGVCGGLVLDLQVGFAGGEQDKVALTLPIRNNTSHKWRGTVQLQLGNTLVPVRIGTIPAGGRRTDTVTVRVDPGQLEVQGSLLIGP